MTAGVEGLTISEWVLDRLTNDATMRGLLGVPSALAARARVQEGIAKEGTPFPHVVFTVTSPVDFNAVGTFRLQTVGTLIAKAVDQATSYAGIRDIAVRLDALLHGRINLDMPVGGVVLTSLRLEAVQYAERTNGLDYRHLGGSYAVTVQ